MGSNTFRTGRAASKSPRSISGSEAQTAMDALRRIVQALRETAADARGATGVSGAQLFVLQQLAEGPLTINQLAERTCTHQSSVSQVARKLEEQGLARREEVPDDHRKIALHLTAGGKSLLRLAPRVAQSSLVEALARLPAKERAGLAAGLVRLAGEMGLPARPPMFFEANATRARRSPRRG